jgi:hypothetical protein
MKQQDDSQELKASKAAYEAPAVLSVAKVTELVRGGSGQQADGPSFLPF